MDLEENLLSTAQYQDKSCSKLIQAVEAIAEYSHMSHPYRVSPTKFVLFVNFQTKKKIHIKRFLKD